MGVLHSLNTNFIFYLPTYCSVVNLVTVGIVHFRVHMVKFDPARVNQER